MSTIASTHNIDLLHDPKLAPLREAAGKVIGAVFYGTLLKTMRNSPLRGELGHGGHGENVFQSQLDTELAKRAGIANRNTLSLAVLERLAPQQLRREPFSETNGQPKTGDIS